MENITNITNITTNMENMNSMTISQELQPLVIIGTQGRVANGKSSLIRALTGINPMKFTKEAEKNMTIKLGYTNAKFFKCGTCPEPWCYQVSHSECIQCGKPNELKLNVSFVDSPGHNDLQATALSGASNMDFCLLVVSADCEQDPETNEHYKAIKILGLEDSTIILHNKIDLVTKDVALERWEKLKQTYGVKFILPICAQFGFGLNYLTQFLVESIPNPIGSKLYEKINLPLKVSIVRSFDVNKQSTSVEKMGGAIVGGTIKTGSLKIGDRVKIIPGIVLSNGLNHPIEAIVETLKTDNTPLDIAYPGGLIGIGLSIDPTLSKEDRLVGNFIIGIDDKTNKIFKTCTITYSQYNPDSSINIKQGDSFVCMLGSIKRVIKVNWIDKTKSQLNFTSSVIMAGEPGDSLVITKLNHIELYGNILDICE
jgi:translation initiation factor 2 subunit 3